MPNTSMANVSKTLGTLGIPLFFRKYENVVTFSQERWGFKANNLPVIASLGAGLELCC